MSAFISTGEAAEKLLFAGFSVKIEYHKPQGCAFEQPCLVVDDVVAVALGFKDGASWKFKAEKIDDFIAKNKPDAEPVNPSVDNIGKFYDQVEVKRKKAVADFEAAKAGGASAKRLSQLAEAAHWAGYTGD